MTTKKTAFRLIVSELLWFLKGDTNVQTLMKEKNPIWDEWAFEQWVKSPEYTGPDMTDFGRRATTDEEFAAIYKIEMDAFKKRVVEDANFAEKYADLGPVYGKQWRSWSTGEGSIDQIANLIDGIKRNPDSRRHIVTAWNPSEVEDMALPPCHALFQFYVADGKLSCQLYQRSADIFLGVVACRFLCDTQSTLMQVTSAFKRHVNGFFDFRENNFIKIIRNDWTDFRPEFYVGQFFCSSNQ